MRGPADELLPVDQADPPEAPEREDILCRRDHRCITHQMVFSGSGCEFEKPGNAWAGSAPE